MAEFMNVLLKQIDIVLSLRLGFFFFILWCRLYAAAAAASLQSCPTLCDPIEGSPPSFPSLGFSRQEHWSGLPFPSPIHETEKWNEVAQSYPTLATPWSAAHQAPPSMGFSRQEYWSGVPYSLAVSSKIKNVLIKWHSNCTFGYSSQWN